MISKNEYGANQCNNLYIESKGIILDKEQLQTQFMQSDDKLMAKGQINKDLRILNVKI